MHTGTPPRYMSGGAGQRGNVVSDDHSYVTKTHDKDDEDSSVHLTTLITSPIKFWLYCKNGEIIQHENFTIAKSFHETNNHVKMIAKYLVVFTAYVRI